MPTKDTDKTPEKKKAKTPAKPKGPALYYSTHNLTGLKPPVKAFVVFNPANHKTIDGKPVTEKVQEFQERGLLKQVAGNAKVGSAVDQKGARNNKGTLSEGAKSRSKK